jgi:D-glycero-alpha-D-manno-heptose 1-phosphate guanylyltransferase
VISEAIILAGGLGTRLRSAVPDLPKSMAPVAGQPFLTYLLQFLEGNGIRRVVLAVGYRSETIRDFFGSSYGSLKLTYSIEEEPLGTGGGLLRALPYVEDRWAFILNGDTFLRLDYKEMASTTDRYPDASLVVALRQVPDGSRYGAAVVVGDRLQGFNARGKAGPALINAGCYLLRQDIFDRYPMPPKFSWEQDFLAARIDEIQPIAFRCDVPFIDIGVPESLRDAQTLIPSWVNTAA